MVREVCFVARRVRFVVFGVHFGRARRRRALLLGGDDQICLRETTIIFGRG